MDDIQGAGGGEGGRGEGERGGEGRGKHGSNVNAMPCEGGLKDDVADGGEDDLDVLCACGRGEVGVDGFVRVVAFGDV